MEEKLVARLLRGEVVGKEREEGEVEGMLVEGDLLGGSGGLEGDLLGGGRGLWL